MDLLVQNRLSWLVKPPCTVIDQFKRCFVNTFRVQTLLSRSLDHPVVGIGLTYYVHVQSLRTLLFHNVNICKFVTPFLAVPKQSTFRFCNDELWLSERTFICHLLESLEPGTYYRYCVQHTNARTARTTQHTAK